MFTKNNYPILEYDDNQVAKLNPAHFVGKPFGTNKLIITFFPEVMEKLLVEGKITLERKLGGENVVLVYRFVDTDILITLGYVGCPACAW